MSSDDRIERQVDVTDNPEPLKKVAGFYRIQYRKDGQQFTAAGTSPGLLVGTPVMVNTEHGAEPARIAGNAPIGACGEGRSQVALEILRICNEEELDKYVKLPESETRAFEICSDLIAKHQLKMNLVRVEKFFNGSKIIFYFTADNRIDFRALVKDLVQEFRTRVEMRQVGVRHETKMIGGIGTCGRELCCSSFIKKFDSVSIKMAKEQDLPLNPTKISGVCNRLLCCLTYEYETYRKQRRNMPKAGKRIRIKNELFFVKRQHVLQNVIVAENSNGEEVMLKESDWRGYQPVKRDSGERQKSKKTSENGTNKTDNNLK